MMLNILILPVLPHTVTYWATDSCALSCDVMSQIIPIKSLLVISTSPWGRECLRRMSIFNIKTTRKSYIPVCKTFDDIGIHRGCIARYVLLRERCHVTTPSISSTNGGKAVLSTVFNKICKWCVYVASSCVCKICMTATSMSSTSATSPSCCIERCKIW